MNLQRFLQQFVSMLIIMSFLIGCGAPATTLQTTSTPSTVTSVPPTAVPTSTPSTVTSVPPTDLPSTATSVPPTTRPTPSLPASPISTALTGAVEIGEKAGSATISFELSADRTAITFMGITVIGPFKCPGGASAGEGAQVTQNFQGPFPIKEGNIDVALAAVGEVKGRLTSPTESSGTITIRKLAYLGSCDLGTFNWHAVASASPSAPTTGIAAPTAPGASAATETAVPATAQPQPGATLTGTMAQSETTGSGTAQSGTISLVVSKDGKEIATGSIKLVNVKCAGASIGSLEQKLDRPSPITEGKFTVALAKEGAIQGQFSTPTEANGTVKLIIEIPFAGTCDLGIWDWSAKSQT